MSPQRDLEGELQPEQTDIWLSIERLADAVAKRRSDMGRPDKLTPMDIAVLDGLLADEERTVSDIAQTFPVSPSRISRVVAKLVGMGLMRRRRLRNDRRVVRLTLTSEGQALARDLQDRAKAYDDQLFEGISEADRVCFVSTSSKILANFETLSTRKR